MLLRYLHHAEMNMGILVTGETDEAYLPHAVILIRPSARRLLSPIEIHHCLLELILQTGAFCVAHAARIR